jgi:hypothetical protein
MRMTGLWDVKSFIIVAKFNYQYSRFLPNFGKFPQGYIAPFVTGAHASHGLKLAQDEVKWPNLVYMKRNVPAPNMAGCSRLSDSRWLTKD